MKKNTLAVGKQNRLLRRPQVEALTGMKRSQIYALMNDGKFPKAIKLGVRIVAWIESEIYAWIDVRIKAAAVVSDIDVFEDTSELANRLMEMAGKANDQVDAYYLQECATHMAGMQETIACLRSMRKRGA
jgi:prophage regulatory protein